jgi:alkaline phosphatase D
MRKSISALAVILASALLAALPQRSTAPNSQAARIRSGPMLGYAELTEASVWIQTTAPADARLRYWPEGRRGEARTTPTLSAGEQTDDTAHFVVPGLEPGSRYSYEVLVAGAPAAFPTGGTTGILTTQPFWQWRTNPPDFTVAFGSCYYANEPKADRPGTPYGSDPGIFRTIAAMKPDVMIWLGDNIYYREVDFGSVAAMRRRNAIGREEPALQPLLSASHHYAVWDDHDFGPNDSTWIFSHWKESFEIFKTYWANPTYGARGVEGVFGQFGWGDVDFFLLDDRMYRTPERVAETPDKTMLGRDQLRWLEHSLSYSNAPFKVVVNGSQMLNTISHGESFAHYVTEQKELLDWIVKNRIRGVLFLSGDRHAAELLSVTPPGSYPLYDFTSSPFTAGLSVEPAEANNPLRVPGTSLVNDMHNFGLLRFRGACNDRTLDMQLYDKTGKARWTYTVRGSDLAPPPRDGAPPQKYRGHPACANVKI